MRTCLILLSATALLLGGTAAAEPEAPENATSARVAELARHVIVSGRGEVTAQPERARVNLMAEARSGELSVARDEVNRVVRDMQRFVRSLGVDDRHISTTGVTIRPEYDWDPQSRERRFLGYYVGRRIDVDLRQLDRLGALIEGAVDRGIGHISEPQLAVAEPAELRRRALALAASDARRNAETLATTLGSRAGPARRIVASEAAAAPEPRMMMMRAETASDSGGADTYAAGELRYSATIEVEFDLLID